MARHRAWSTSHDKVRALNGKKDCVYFFRAFTTVSAKSNSNCNGLQMRKDARFGRRPSINRSTVFFTSLKNVFMDKCSEEHLIPINDSGAT